MADRLGWLPRLVDVRSGEWMALVRAFATLLSLIAAHTALETARDALLLTRLPSSSLAVVYVAVAVCVLPTVGLASRAAVRFGPRLVLAGGLLTATTLLIGLYLVPMNRYTAIAVYVTSGLIGAVLVPLFWNLLANIFNVAQGRRLLGLVGAAGVLGGTVGSTAAASLLMVLHTRALLLVSAGGLLLTATLVVRTPARERGLTPTPTEVLPTPRDAADLRDEPFLRRIALLVVVSTAGALFLDYFFKWAVARTVPPHEIARFVARTYAGLNVLSLVAQVLLTGTLVRRVGVATTMIVTPLFMLVGGVGAIVLAGLLSAALALKVLDGTLRNSVHRVTTELLYLPLPPVLRARAKPFVDGALARLTQAVSGLVLLALGSAGFVSAGLLEAMVLGAIALWLGVAVSMRWPYLAMLRHAVVGDATNPPELDPLDIESAETLVELLAHEEPIVVQGAMRVLARRGRERLIPALILLHEDPAVLVRALGIFGASGREDWVPRGRRALTDPREAVRTAAARALAMHGRLDARDLALDADPRLHAYAALQLALTADGDATLQTAVIGELLDRPGEAGDEGRLGLLACIVDARPDPRLGALLLALDARAGSSRDWTEGLASAAASQRAIALIPHLVSRLALRDSREAVRAALVTFGRPALAALATTLQDSRVRRSVRVHVPNSIARFAMKPAAEVLLRCIESEKDGLVRYKAIRGLDRLVADHGVATSRARVERLAYANLVEHFRLLGLRAPFEAGPTRAEAGLARTTEVLLLGLLEDKLRQSIERTFRLLQIAHPRDDLHRVQIARQSKDGRTRANAGELLDALLRRRDQTGLRELLSIEADDLTMAERVARGSALLGTRPPGTREAAIALLVQDSDAAVAALAALHAATLAGKPARVELSGGLGGRPAIELSTAARSPLTPLPPEPRHAG